MLMIIDIKYRRSDYKTGNTKLSAHSGGPKAGAGYMGGGDVQLLSFGATATSSSVAHGGLPTRAIDGRPNRRWSDK